MNTWSEEAAESEVAAGALGGAVDFPQGTGGRAGIDGTGLVMTASGCRSAPEGQPNETK
jgi:hypothetical protein